MASVVSHLVGLVAILEDKLADAHAKFLTALEKVLTHLVALGTVFGGGVECVELETAFAGKCKALHGKRVECFQALHNKAASRDKKECAVHLWALTSFLEEHFCSFSRHCVV